MKLRVALHIGMNDNKMPTEITTPWFPVNLKVSQVIRAEELNEIMERLVNDFGKSLIDRVSEYAEKEYQHCVNAGSNP